MIRQFKDLFARLGWKRARERRVYAFEESLDKELVGLAEKRKVPVEKFVSDLVANALTKLKKSQKLEERWGTLSAREQQVSALTCLRYTNRQIAAKLGVGEETVKTHVRNALRKFNMYGKLEMMTALKEWDFSEWGEKEDG